MNVYLNTFTIDCFETLSIKLHWMCVCKREGRCVKVRGSRLWMSVHLCEQSVFHKSVSAAYYECISCFSSRFVKCIVAADLLNQRMTNVHIRMFPLKMCYVFVITIISPFFTLFHDFSPQLFLLMWKLLLCVLYNTFWQSNLQQTPVVFTAWTMGNISILIMNKFKRLPV